MIDRTIDREAGELVPGLVQGRDLHKNMDDLRSQRPEQPPERGLTGGHGFWAVVAVGVACFFALVWDISAPVPWSAFLLLMVAAVASDFLLGNAPRDYVPYLSAPFLLAGVLLLPAPPLAMLVVTVHLASWLRTKHGWRVLAFDASVWLAGVAAAHLVYGSLFALAGPHVPDFSDLVASVAAAGVLTVLCRLFVVVVNRPDGTKLSIRSRLLPIDGLLTQFVVLLLGVPIALFWQFNPWLTLAALAPLLLIHRALNVPELEKEARTDIKTGLHNMKSFNEALDRELQRASRFGHSVSILMIDLDLLRQVNNSFGHQAGDAVLLGIADALRSQVREYDVAARFGGDEFVVLLVECDSAHALRVADRARRLVESLRFEVPTSLVAVKATISVGVATFPRHGSTTEEIMYQADQAVFRAKLGGRNRVCLAPPPKETAAGEALDHAKPQYEERFWEDRVGSSAGLDLDDLEDADPVADSRGATVTDRRQDRRLGDAPRALQALMGAVILCALAMVGLAVQGLPGLDWVGLISLVLLTMAAEAWALDLYGDSSISLMVIPIMSVAMLFGVPGGVIIGLTAGVCRGLLRHSQPYKIAFNTAVFILGASLAGTVFRAFGIAVRPDDLPLLLIPTLSAALIYYVVNTSFISVALGLSVSQNPMAIWREQFRWLLVHYVVFGLLGLFLATAYNAFGLYGLLAFVAPALAMRYVMAQYIGNTTGHVSELRRLNAEMQRSNEEMACINEDLLSTLAAAIDVRDPFVYGHSTKVAEYAVSIARELRMSDAMIELIRQAALLHDIGKLGIAESILHKPARLDPDEYEQVKTHSTLGAELLTKMRRLQHLIPAIKHHHEWYNGGGYPSGLVGDEIPIDARILAVCDAIEAMASDRPYHRAFPVDQIVAELQRCAGLQFDPTVVHAFVRVIGQGGCLVSNSAQSILTRDGLIGRHNGAPKNHSDSLHEMPRRESTLLTTAAAFRKFAD